MAEWFNSLRQRLRAIVHRRRFERDLQDEVAFHLAMREEQLRAAGVSDAEAGARRRFGNVTRTREDLRAAWAIAPGVNAVLRDLRYAARMLRRSPAFTSVVVLTLGLCVGANTALFTVVNGVLVRSANYPDSDRLIVLHESFSKASIDRLPFSALDFDDFRRYQQSFASVDAFRSAPFELAGGGSPQRIVGAKITAGLFDTLGVGPAIGRTFSTDDDRPGADSAILSWGLWQRRFAADPSVLGQRILLDRQPFTIVGVMPARFVFPQRGLQFNGEPADVWVPMAFTSRERLERGSMHRNSVVARLKTGVTLPAARNELAVLADQIAASYPQAVRDAGFSPTLFAQPLSREISGRFEAPLLTLLGAVGLVLLVACANVANLILSRAATRQREFAVRTALGAGRVQLVQLLLCEAALLAAAAGVVAITIAYVAVKAVPAVLARSVPGLQDLSIDVRVLAFTGTISLATAVLFALVPLHALERRRNGDALREDTTRTTSSRAKLRLQRTFVVVTVSLACVLLVGAGLFIRSFAALVATDVGFRPAGVLTASMTLPRSHYATAASVRSFHDSLSRSLQALPGVRTVALATDLPLTTYDLRAFAAEGVVLPAGAQAATNLSWVHGPYFEALGMALESGRFFATDEHIQNRQVVIVNDKLAALAWPGQDAIGKRLKWGNAASPAPWLTVVGVVRSVVDGPLGTSPKIHAYEPFRQLPDFFLNGATNQFGRDVKAAVLTQGDPAVLASLVRQAVARLDSELAIESILPMTEQIREVVAPQRFSTLLVSIFAATALLLASVGLYGLLALATSERQKEIAVRMALGARRRAVIGLVVGQGARLVLAGMIVGLLGSLVMTRLVASLLYQPHPYDVVAFLLIPAALVPAALLACLLPAWRATRVEPVAALRGE